MSSTLCCCSGLSGGNGPVISFQVGVVLELDTELGHRALHCLRIAHSNFYSRHANYTTRLVLHVRDSKGNVIDAAASTLLFNLELNFFVQTAQTDDTEVGAIAAIIKTFQWNQVVIIYEDSEYGNGIVPYLTNALQDINARFAYKNLIPVSAHEDFMLKELYKLMTMQTRVFIVHVSHSLGPKLFLKAKSIGMMSEGYIWIITSGLMDLLPSMNLHVVEAMQGVLGIKPLIPKTSNVESFRLQKTIFDLTNPGYKPADIMSIFYVWAYDTLWALAMAAEQVGTHYPEASNQDTNSSDLFNLPISKTGRTWRDAPSRRWRVGFKKVGPNTSDDFYSKEDFSSIIWPGRSRVVPRGWEVPVRGKKLRVVVAVRPGFEEYLNVIKDSRTGAVHFSGDYIDGVTMMKVFLQNYDAAIGDITITGNRSNYVDFTLPFAEGGVVRIVPDIPKDSTFSNSTVLAPVLQEESNTAIDATDR
ncbi:hypothetical protein K7X08_023861 [Anisodus acutangulus]|uniref:Receptor ligand binding region domain-containing protein n=1 Tax=Anisodus acutangulus TaxID=402998 RepID=A0A9Q1M6P6_9SOLA|nr:hypothetical protein K7X08_023861 [Anisodus acutangulus]